MAQQVLVRLIDDVNGEEEADETVMFSIDGVEYEIDLTSRHASELRRGIEPFVEVARRITPVGKRAVARSTSAKGPAKTTTELTKVERTSLRIWAEQEGIPISDRGRIAASVLGAWREAGSPKMT
jgi:hypothetical protein